MRAHFLATAAAATVALSAAVPASAASTTFMTSLSSADETVSTSMATGAAVVTFDDVARTVTVQLSFQGLANNAPFGHIHCCTASPGAGAAPVVLQFPSLPAATAGVYDNVFMPASFDALFAGTSAGLAYVNIHTPGIYGGGEIRGFLPAVTAVPEPGSYALMLAGLASFGWAARKRRVS